jgi:hypothetical protein
MEQLYLFAPPEIIRNKAMNALTKAEFIRSEKHWQELRLLDPGNRFIDDALDICRFWNRLYPEEDLVNQADPLEIYARWREFETYLDGKGYRENALIGRLKEHIFLKNIGLEYCSLALRESFERHDTELLDLLMEIGKWSLAAEEIRAVRTRDPSRQDGVFFLKCSKVYLRAENVPTSRRFLLEAFWAAPNLIELSDVTDPDLLHDLEDVYPDYAAREGSVELIPYAGLMAGSFTFPLEDRQNYLSSLRKNREKHETRNGRMPDARTRNRLFSLCAWESELAQLTGASYVNGRNRMKALDSELFDHYMRTKRRVENRGALSIQS